MRFNFISTAVTIGIIGLASSMSQAALVAGWNSTNEGWEWDGNGTSPNNTLVDLFDTTRFTEGSASLRPTSNGNGYRLLAKGFGPAVINGAIAAGNATNPVIVSVDIQIPTDSFVQGNGTFFQAVIARNSNFGFTNIGLPSVVPGSWNTVSATLPAGDVIGATFFGIHLGINTNWTVGTGPDAAVVLFDNLRISPIPEPATLGLIAGAGALVLRRRRA